MTRWFVYTSGDNTELAKAEVVALLNMLPSNFDLCWSGRLGIVESRANIPEFILKRAAFTQRAGKILYESDSIEDIVRLLSDDYWREIVSTDETFSVKTFCINKEIPFNQRFQLECELGARIKRITDANVNLENANVQILVIISSTKILVCISNESKLRKDLREREPGKKLFFHPSMMNSSLARAMCNLVGIKEELIVLDPFCGAGGILCEASYIGASVVGFDVNWKLVNGAKRNLENIGQNYCVLQADVLHFPISSVDYVVTDPPYGRSSSTRGSQSISLVEGLLKKIDGVIQSRGERVCICGSTEMKLPQLIEREGYQLGQDLKLRVHSGLVRELVTVIL